MPARAATASKVMAAPAVSRCRQACSTRTARFVGHGVSVRFMSWSSRSTRRRWRAASSAPAAGVGVGGEGGGVGALGGQDGQEGRFGAEVGAVLADVGVGAGALGRGAQAVPAGQPGLDRRGVSPVGAAAADVGDRQRGAWRQHGPELGFGQGEGAFVVGADGGVEQPPVAQAHLRRDVAEHGHQRLQRDPGVDQGGGVGVSSWCGVTGFQARLRWRRGSARRAGCPRRSAVPGG